ncbi:MAG: response regulator [Halonotius sp.]
MSAHPPDEPTVLVVDDEPDVAELYAYRLRKEYTVRQATSGEAALDALDETIDVVLLDRRMPGMTGDEVLDRIRDTDYDTRVVMVTAVDPDVEIIDMPFDDYLCKPIGRDALIEAVDQQLTARAYSETMQELIRATSKKGVLEAELPADELADSDEYQTLEGRIDELRAHNSELLDELDDYEAAFNAVEHSAPELGSGDTSQEASF